MLTLSRGGLSSYYITSKDMKFTLLGLTVSAFLSLLLEKSVHPNVNFILLLVILFVTIAVDFMSGIIKSVVNNIPVISGKIRRTVLKVGEYFVVMIGSFILSFMISIKGGHLGDELGKILNTCCICFLIYTELTSICENLIEADRRGYVSKVIKPVHYILTGKWIAVILLLNKGYDDKKKQEEDGK